MEVYEAIAAVTSQSEVLGSENLKNFATTHIRGERNTAGDLTINWLRRTRILYRMFGPIIAPLDETQEKYSVDIYNGAVFKRTLTPTTGANSVVYTAALQATDGFTLGDPVNVEIFQLGGFVGRGRKGAKAI